MFWGVSLSGINLGLLGGLVEGLLGAGLQKGGACQVIGGGLPKTSNTFIVKLQYLDQFRSEQACCGSNTFWLLDKLASH